MTTLQQMRGRTALVTGATMGIGAAFAAKLASQGADLVLVARSADRLERVAAELREKDRVQVHTVPLDLAESEAARELWEQLQSADATVEMLINNAGVSHRGPVATTDPATLDAMIRLNVGAVTALTAFVLPGMIERGSGTIVNVASTGAFQPSPYLAAYAASKAYVLSFTQALWAETTGSGVRVLALSPGPTDTPMNAAVGSRKRSAEQVVETAFRALSEKRASVIDGAGNAVLAQMFSKRFPDKVVLSLAERVLRPRSNGGRGQ